MPGAFLGPCTLQFSHGTVGVGKALEASGQWQNNRLFKASMVVSRPGSLATLSQHWWPTSSHRQFLASHAPCTLEGTCG